LHEILAVEGSLTTTAKAINQETIKTFGKKDEHFIATSKRVTYFKEDDQKLNTIETKEMVTTVGEKLDWMKKANIKSWDVYLQKEAANQNAVADVEIEGKVILEKVPATVLLGMETKLAELRAVYEAIPTLAPGPSWTVLPTSKKGVYTDPNPVVTFRSQKNLRPIELSPATKEHPAQVQTVSEDIPVAKIEVQTESGMLSVADKSDLLERLDNLLRAVKRARQRANGTTVDKDKKMGEVLFNYLHAGVV
jgi:hypothetical protein